MSTELKGPFITLIKKYILEKSIISFKLGNNEVINGKILWCDKNSLHIEDESKRMITIMLDHVVTFYPKD